MYIIYQNRNVSLALGRCLCLGQHSMAPKQVCALPFSLPSDIDAMLISEERQFKRGSPNCPRLIDTVNIPQLAKQLRTEHVEKIFQKRGYEVIFMLGDDSISHMTRAIQEDQILGTRFTKPSGDAGWSLDTTWRQHSCPPTPNPYTSTLVQGGCWTHAQDGGTG